MPGTMTSPFSEPERVGRTDLDDLEQIAIWGDLDPAPFARIAGPPSKRGRAGRKAGRSRWIPIARRISSA